MIKMETLPVYDKKSKRKEQTFVEPNYTVGM